MPYFLAQGKQMTGCTGAEKLATVAVAALVAGGIGADAGGIGAHAGGMGDEAGGIG